MRYRTSATPADALGLGDMISPEYAASLMSDAASSATEWDVLHLVWQVDLAEQRRAAVDRPSVRHVGNPTRDLADAATNLLVVGARERRAGQSHRTADGTREDRHDAQRVHAGDRWLVTASGRHRRGRPRTKCFEQKRSLAFGRRCQFCVPLVEQAA